jgi:hypothetical protein
MSKVTPRHIWQINRMFQNYLPHLFLARNTYTIPINNQIYAQFLLYIFISILYMFRATLCSSSGDSVVSIQHLVYVTVHSTPSGIKGIVRQVGYLLELYRDARSPEY